MQRKCMQPTFSHHRRSNTTATTTTFSSPPPSLTSNNSTHKSCASVTTIPSPSSPNSSLSPSPPSPPSLDYILSLFLNSPHSNPRISIRALQSFSRATNNPHRALIAYADMRRAKIKLNRFMLPTLFRAVVRVEGEDGVAVWREAHGVVLKFKMSQREERIKQKKENAYQREGERLASIGVRRK